MYISADAFYLALMTPGHRHHPLLMLLLLLGLILFVIQIIDLVRRQFPEPSIRVVWAIVVIFVPCVGPILYGLIGRQQGTMD